MNWSGVSVLTEVCVVNRETLELCQTVVCVCVCFHKTRGEKKHLSEQWPSGVALNEMLFFPNPHLTQEAFTRSSVRLFFQLLFSLSSFFELIFDIRACPGMSVTNCSPTL